MAAAGTDSSFERLSLRAPPAKIFVLVTRDKYAARYKNEEFRKFGQTDWKRLRRTEAMGF